jgi:hypothetical protein
VGGSSVADTGDENKEVSDDDSVFETSKFISLYT